MDHCAEIAFSARQNAENELHKLIGKQVIYNPGNELNGIRLNL
jgi:hypothetical protein